MIMSKYLWMLRAKGEKVSISARLPRGQKKKLLSFHVGDYVGVTGVLQSYEQYGGYITIDNDVCILRA